ncbi:MBL fold metallo-hydrolase [Glutamicibacter halophytocola]|uniref:MBL fold metallo-hydrolase n=1 Tax=Glutamicibacter halophytocola TaxID=1933880 RepID=A0ABX5YBL5_9MICC|nr:rhodanese-like domain-containing protein [Glutamicibacter halophytocola]NQD42784.1 MBL fold metallo-hydrolase [Glutamicibacter halophytocola]QDY67056.1 MBL fold metallo-hydrolase [Glutamicibacter halophytocola]
MLLERLYDEDLAQASYFIGCQAKGEALVVDARRDISDYLALAAKHGMRITAAAETHIHADYLSGTRELAAATGATAYVSGEGGKDWQYGFEAERLMDGDAINLGNLKIIARHTPGHTPEHLSYLLTDGAFSSSPGYLLSGDFIFAGDLGRPDLLDEAAGGVDTRFAGARDLYASLKKTLAELPDYIQVHPGHGSGSACGKALGAVPSTTLGYEREFSWWAGYLANNDEQGFIDELLNGQPDAHAYFARMKRENREGPAVLGPLPHLEKVCAQEILAQVQDGAAVFVDTRSHIEIAAGTVPGALSIPGLGKTASFGAWAYDPENDQRSMIVLAQSAEHAERIRAHLMRVGIDAVTGYATSLEGLPLAVPKSISPAQLEEFAYELLLDVRNKNEYAAGHIPGARHLSGGKVLWHQQELPAGGKIVTYCQSGMRNAVAASALRDAGFDVVELEGSYLGWKNSSN